MAANLLNVMNLLAYGCMVFTTIALASEKLQVNSLFESYDDYKSFLHPSKGLFYFMWCLTAVFEGMFAFTQLTKHYRNSALVRYGIQHFYFFAAMMRVSQLFEKNKDDLALIAATMLIVTISFFLLLKCQNITLKLITSRNESADLSWLDTLMLRVPFGIHFGWSLSETAVTLCSYAVQQKFNHKHQCNQAIILLIAMTVVSFAMVCCSRPDYASPAVIACCMIGFAAGDMPDTQYSTTIKVLAGCLSGINILFIPGRILYPKFAHKKQERETQRNDLQRIDEEE